MVRFARVLGMLAAVLLAAALVPATVLADGDPASDILLGENVFYPFSPPVSNDLQRELGAETAAANHAHLPIKVAVIASPTDLGAIPELFGKPQQYATFLEQEISFLSVKPALIVVMPAGYGVAGFSAPAAAAVSSLAKPSGPQSNDLVRAAIAAVPKLAAAAGHPIAGVSGAPSTSAANSAAPLDVAIVALAAVAIAVAIILMRRRRAASGPRER